VLQLWIGFFGVFCDGEEQVIAKRSFGLAAGRTSLEIGARKSNL